MSRRHVGAVLVCTGFECAGIFTERDILTRVVEISNSNILVENRLKSICDLLNREGRIDCICFFRREPRGEAVSPCSPGTGVPGPAKRTVQAAPR